MFGVLMIWFHLVLVCLSGVVLCVWILAGCVWLFRVTSGLMLVGPAGDSACCLIVAL